MASIILQARHMIEYSKYLALGGNQRSSEVIRGHQRSSEVIRGHQRSSEVIRGHQVLAVPCIGRHAEARVKGSVHAVKLNDHLVEVLTGRRPGRRALHPELAGAHGSCPVRPADLKREAQACKRAVAGDAGHKQPAAPIVPPDEALAAHLMREPIRGTRRSSKAPNRHRRLQRALKRHPDPSSCAYGVIGLVDGAIDKQRGNDASVRQRETRVVERDIGEHE